MKRPVMVDYTSLTEYQKDKYVRRMLKRRKAFKRAVYTIVLGALGFLAFCFISSLPYMLFGYDYIG